VNGNVEIKMLSTGPMRAECECWTNNIRLSRAGLVSMWVEDDSIRVRI
jgi:hypothetical protein